MIDYLTSLSAAFAEIRCHVDEIAVSGDKALEMAAGAILDGDKSGRKMIIVGNGGSAAVASHIATDAIKNADLRALTFTDAALLTCLSNDYGYAEVYATPVKMFGQPGDVLIAISSSGNSENIIRAVEEAREIGMVIITLSGFDPGNRLRRLGRLSFYVPAYAYGMVEITHLAILHGIIDMIITRR